MVTAMKVHSLAFSLAAMVLSAVGARLSAEVGSPEYRLVLTDGSTLKAVFDAGLRPRRWPDRLQHVCRTGRVSLRLSLAGRRDFAFEAESTSFDVLAEHKLSSANFESSVMPLDEAAAQMKNICTATGLPETGLDELLASISTAPVIGETWFNSCKMGDIRFAATFYPLYRPERTDSAKLTLSVVWKFKPGVSDFLTEPVQPPPGYESESMEPLPFKPTGPPSPSPKDYPAFVDRPPEAKAEMIRWAQAHGIAVREDPAAAKPPPNAKDRAQESVNGLQPTSFRWWHGVAAAIAVVLLGAAVRKSRTAKNSDR